MSSKTASPGGAKLQVTGDPNALARVAADHLLAWAMESSGTVRIALSGGSTPRGTYQELVTSRMIGRFPWPKVHWYWGDERFVPPDDPASNFRMVREAMLNAAPIPSANIHPIPTVGLSADEAALRYEEELKRAYGDMAIKANRPLFDVCLLGLGDDGHTASLIPGEPVLLERNRWVGVVGHGRPEVRITLTYPAIDASRHIAFLVSGKDKRAVLQQVLAGDTTKPAARLVPAGDLLFIADRAAAGA